MTLKTAMIGHDGDPVARFDSACAALIAAAWQVETIDPSMYGLSVEQVGQQTLARVFPLDMENAPASQFVIERWAQATMPESDSLIAIICHRYSAEQVGVLVLGEIANVDAACQLIYAYKPTDEENEQP